MKYWQSLKLLILNLTSVFPYLIFVHKAPKRSEVMAKCRHKLPNSLTTSMARNSLSSTPVLRFIVRPGQSPPLQIELGDGEQAKDGTQ